MTAAPPEPNESVEHAALRAQVGLYFDGELALSEETAVLDHLAACAACQDELGDAIGIHVGAATPPPRRWRAAALGLVTAVLRWPRVARWR